MDGKKIVSTAKQYIGYTGRKFCEDYGLPWGSDWCCAYVWDIFRIAGASSLFYGGQKTAYVPTATVWLQANCKHITMAKAQPGDIVIMTWSGNGYNKERGSRNHIGIIRKAGTQNVAYTIEGNTGSTDATKTKVMERERASRYIYGIYRPNYSNQYTIKFDSRNGSGKMLAIKVTAGEKIKLPANKFKREGFKFCGWGVDAHDVQYKHLTLGTVKYKSGATVKDLAKPGDTITLRACWRGVGGIAAAYWARRIAKNNDFTYGEDNHKNWHNGRDRAHQVGCYYCGTTITGPKKAKKGSRWATTYCCNSFVIACFTHGANIFKKCKAGSTSVSYWLKLKANGKELFKTIGNNVPYKELRRGDILIKEGKHIKIFTGKSKIKGFYLVSHAAGEGWGPKSIRTDRVRGRIGKEYTALRFLGHK